MPIQAYFTTVDPNEVVVKVEKVEEEILETLGPELETLGPEEEAVAIKLQELFEAITKSIADSISVESKLTVEVTGSISLKAKGGFQYLFLNAGAEASKTGTMKVVLSTTLQPKT